MTIKEIVRKALTVSKNINCMFLIMPFLVPAFVLLNILAYISEALNQISSCLQKLCLGKAKEAGQEIKHAALYTRKIPLMILWLPIATLKIWLEIIQNMTKSDLKYNDIIKVNIITSTDIQTTPRDKNDRNSSMIKGTETIFTLWMLLEIAAQILINALFLTFFAPSMITTILLNDGLSNILEAIKTYSIAPAIKQFTNLGHGIKHRLTNPCNELGSLNPWKLI